MSKDFVNADLLEAIRKAEASLKAKEDGNDKRDDLPPGHPFLRMMEESKERLKAESLFEKESKERAKKKKEERGEKGRKVAEERRKVEAAQKSAKQINAKIEDLGRSMVELVRAVDGNSDSIESYPFAKAKMLRLKRTLMAVYRVLEDSRIGSSRFGGY